MNTTLYQDLHHQGILLLIIFLQGLWFHDKMFSEELCQLEVLDLNLRLKCQDFTHTLDLLKVSNFISAYLRECKCISDNAANQVNPHSGMIKCFG